MISHRKNLADGIKLNRTSYLYIISNIKTGSTGH